MKGSKLITTAVLVAAAATGYAAGEPVLTVDYTTVATGVLAQIQSVVTANLPTGVLIVAVIIGIGFALKLIKRFTGGK